MLKAEEQMELMVLKKHGESIQVQPLLRPAKRDGRHQWAFRAWISRARSFSAARSTRENPPSIIWTSSSIPWTPSARRARPISKARRTRHWSGRLGLHQRLDPFIEASAAAVPFGFEFLVLAAWIVGGADKADMEMIVMSHDGGNLRQEPPVKTSG